MYCLLQNECITLRIALFIILFRMILLLLEKEKIKISPSLPFPPIPSTASEFLLHHHFDFIYIIVL